MEKENPKVYFGRPASLYGTPLEKKLIRIITNIFSHYALEDPSLLHHQEGYKKCKAERSDGDGMMYFLQDVIPKMSAGVFTPFEDGMFGAGVFREAEELSKYTHMVYELRQDGIMSAWSRDLARRLSVEETRERVYGKE